MTLLGFLDKENFRSKIPTSSAASFEERKFFDALFQDPNLNVYF